MPQDYSQEDSNSLYNQMRTISDQIGQYSGSPTQGQIQNDLNARVGNFQPQYQEAANQMAKAYAMPAEMMQGFYKDYGTDPSGGASQMSRLSSILRNIGNAYGTSDVLNNVISTQRGRLGDMSKDIFDQGQQQQNNLMQRYQLISPLYQSKLQQEEAAKARAAAGGGGGWNNLPWGPGGDEIYQDTITPTITANGQDAGSNNAPGGLANYYKDNLGKIFNKDFSKGGWQNRLEGGLSATPLGAIVNGFTNGGLYNLFK